MENSTLNDTQMNALFSSHNLDYSPPESSNLILSRSSCDKQSTLNEYKSGSNNSIDVYLGSDNELLWGPSSYLSFDLTYNEGTTPLSSAKDLGSVVSSLFTRITVTSKGTVIYDVDGYNILNNMETEYACPETYLNNTASVEAYNLNWNPLFNDNTKRVAMSLHNISFFAQDKYIPLLALSPLKVSFYLNKPQNVFKVTGNVADPTGTYSIANFKMNLDLFVPQDVVRVGILKLVKQQVLTLAYTHYSHLNAPIETGSQNTVNLRKSVQKCQSIFSQVRERYDDTYESVKDNRLSVPYSFIKSWYYNAGCKRMPSNPVTNSIDAYISAMNAYGTFTSCTRTPSISLKQFEDAQSILAIDLEKDITAEAMLSGISLNSTDDISLTVQIGDVIPVVGVKHQIDVFLSYLRLIVVGTSNISIKE